MDEITAALAMDVEDDSMLQPQESSQDISSYQNLLDPATDEILEVSSQKSNEGGDENLDGKLESVEPSLDRSEVIAGAVEHERKAVQGEAKEHEWVSVHLPFKQAEMSDSHGMLVESSIKTIEDHCAGSAREDKLAGTSSRIFLGESFMRTDQTEWVSVDQVGSDSVCSSPCSLVEWITVEMPSATGQASTCKVQPTAGSMRVNEHVCVRFSEAEKKLYQKSAAPGIMSGLPRTRRRRTISGKIKARIEAFENTFRQELDRLNSPLGKARNRRVHEGLRRGSIGAVVAKEEGRVSEVVEVPKKLEQKAMLDIATQVVDPTESEVDQDDLRPQEITREASTGEEETVTCTEEEEFVAETVVLQARTEELEEWELTGKCSQQQEEQHKNTNGIKEEAFESVQNQSTGGICVGGLMKQVISGAALLAGLIFLWPRGNNSIWRCGWVEYIQLTKQKIWFTGVFCCFEFFAYLVFLHVQYLKGSSEKAEILHGEAKYVHE